MMGLGLCEFEPDAVVEKPIATALSPDALVVKPTATASLPCAEVPAQPIVGHVFPFCGVIDVTSATKAHNRRSVWRSEDIAATGVAPGETCHPAHAHDPAEAPTQAPPSGVVAARLAASAVEATGSLRVYLWRPVTVIPHKFISFHHSPLTVPAAARALCSLTPCDFRQRSCVELPPEELHLAERAFFDGVAPC